MSEEEGLREYSDRRDLEGGPEPDGSGEIPDVERPLFVIQQHDAQSMHWDFRLEIDDVLVSWAVPKGPSTDPADKRLAVRTDDHPLEYAGFEGVIPEDEYGGGAVIVWDRGGYGNLRKDKDDESLSMSESLEDGRIEVSLRGEKLRGGYALIHARVGGDEDAWLLVKMDDEEADARRNPTSTEPESVQSGDTVEEVAEEGEPDEPSAPGNGS